MERDYKEFGIRHFIIEDDNMTWNTVRFERICDLMVERGLEKHGPQTVSAPDRLNEELVRKMKRTGCKPGFGGPGIRFATGH